MTLGPSDEDLGEVLFEFTAIGRNVKVVAIQDITHTLPFFLIEGIAHLATAFSLPSYFHETSLPLISL